MYSLKGRIVSDKLSIIAVYVDDLILLTETAVEITKTKKILNLNPILYQSLIGSLLYGAIATPPDIAHTVGVVTKFCASPDESHLL